MCTNETFHIAAANPHPTPPSSPPPSPLVCCQVHLPHTSFLIFYSLLFLSPFFCSSDFCSTLGVNLFHFSSKRNLKTFTMGNRNNKVASNETNYKGAPNLTSPPFFFFHHLSHTGKKFNKCYMLARELGSGAFSVVKLGVNKVMPHSPSLPPSPLCSVAHPFSHRKLVKMLQSKLFRKRNYLMRIWLHFIQKLKFYQGSITLTSSSLPSLLSPSLPSESSTTPFDHLHSFSSLLILLS
jgi:hypothetical protein